MAFVQLFLPSSLIDPFDSEFFHRSLPGLVEVLGRPTLQRFDKASVVVLLFKLRYLRSQIAVFFMLPQRLLPFGREGSWKTNFSERRKGLEIVNVVMLGGFIVES